MAPSPYENTTPHVANELDVCDACLEAGIVAGWPCQYVHPPGSDRGPDPQAPPFPERSTHPD